MQVQAWLNRVCLQSETRRAMLCGSSCMYPQNSNVCSLISGSWLHRTAAQLGSLAMSAILFGGSKLPRRVFQADVIAEWHRLGNLNISAMQDFDLHAISPRRKSTMHSQNSQRSHQAKERCFRIALLLGGGRWIRTTEGIASRFTVCPLWPLGNSPIFDSAKSVELVDGLEPPTC